MDTLARNRFNIVLFILFLSACKAKDPVVQKTISVENLQKLNWDTVRGYTSLKILKTYPNQSDCSSNKQYFTNLYVCLKLLSKPDTIYVFDGCKEPPDFATDTSLDMEVGIFTTDTLKNHPNKVTIFVPPKFQIPKNAKYVFGRLNGVML